MRVNVSTEQYHPMFEHLEKKYPYLHTESIGPHIEVENHANKHQELSALAQKSVLQIFSTISQLDITKPFAPGRSAKGRGSGWLHNGDILTNYHVIKGATKIEAASPETGQQRYLLEVKAVFPEGDLAVCGFKDSKPDIGLKSLELANSDLAQSGDKVVAIGYPLGREGQCLTGGMVSSHQQLGPNEVIQTDAAINPGNSGGPLVCAKTHKVIGINSSIIRNTNNVGFAIPANDIAAFLKNVDILSKEQKAPIFVSKPVFGLFAQKSTKAQTASLGNKDISNGAGGFYVSDVLKDSLLGKSTECLQSGDQICSFNGHSVNMYGDTKVSWSKTPVSLSRILNRMTFGENIEIGVYRKGKLVNINLKYEPCDPRAVRPIFHPYQSFDYEVIGGMVVSELTQNHVGLIMKRNPLLTKYLLPDNLLCPAVLISSVLQGSYLFDNNINVAGSILTKVNGTNIQTMDDFRNVFKTHASAHFFTFETDIKTHFVIPKQNIIADEQALKPRFNYKLSGLMQYISQDFRIQQVAQILESLPQVKDEIINEEEEPKQDETKQDETKQEETKLEETVAARAETSEEVRVENNQTENTTQTFALGDRVRYSKKKETFDATIVAFSSSKSSAKFQLDDGSFLTKKVRHCTAIPTKVPAIDTPIVEKDTPILQEEEEIEEEEQQIVLTDAELRELQSTLGLNHLSINEVRLAYETKTLY